MTEPVPAAAPLLTDHPSEGVVRLLREWRAFELLFCTADHKEGMQAFADRRPAVSSGR